MLLFLGVDGKNVAAKDKGVGDLKVAVTTLMQFLGFVRRRVFLKLGRPMEAFSADGAFVRVVLSVHGNNVPFKVAGVGTAMVAVAALVPSSVLVRRRVLRQLLLFAEGLTATLAAERQFATVFRFHVRLQVRRVRRFIIAVRARIRLFPGVRPHVFL